MRFSFVLKNRKFTTEVNEMKGLMRGVGLTFKNRNTENLLFRFTPKNRTAITSVFVFFPFLAIWLDENKKVIEKKIIVPFQLSITPKKDAAYLLELPINSKNLGIISKMGFPVGKERFK